LLRQYGFGFGDLVFEADGNLPLDRDPKTAWAEAHPAAFPVELLRASRDELLRVPGIGPRAVDRLLTVRRRTVLRGPEDLKRLGIDGPRAAYWTALRGRRLARQPLAEQLRLFPPGGHLPAVVWNTPVPPCAYR
jgi:predicted DNA-binding helix-hairpin-helix protein